MKWENCVPQVLDQIITHTLAPWLIYFANWFALIFKIDFIIQADTADSGSVAISSGENGVDDSEAGDEQTIKEACDELTEHFKHRLVESLLRSTRYSLDVMRKRFFSRYVC